MKCFVFTAVLAQVASGLKSVAVAALEINRQRNRQDNGKAVKKWTPAGKQNVQAEFTPR